MTVQPPTDEMFAIDRAIDDLLAPLGGGWVVDSIGRNKMKVQPIGENASYLTVAYNAAIRNNEGLWSEGEGETVGDAIAQAFMSVQRQALRSRAR